MIIDDIALSFVPLGKKVLIEALKRIGSAEKIFSLSHYELTCNDGLSDRDAEKLLKNRDYCYEKAEKYLTLANDLCVTVIPYTSSSYPKQLKDCIDAPVVIYVMGNTDLTVKEEKWLSIVGARKCSEVSADITVRMVADIADRQRESVIVSGLSYGIESFACREAVKRNLRVVAVTVNSFDKMSEYERKMAGDILANKGTLLSEYPPSYGYYPQNYEQRNKIIAGLSHATVLVEARIDSNSLKTALFAGGYEREVFAFPGGARDVDFEGCNMLIKRRDAELITDFRDIEDALEMKKSIEPKNVFNLKLSPVCEKIYDCLKDGKMRSDEQIMEMTGLSIIEFNSNILSLTAIHDVVAEFSGRIYQKR